MAFFAHCTFQRRRQLQHRLLAYTIGSTNEILGKHPVPTTTKVLSKLIQVRNPGVVVLMSDCPRWFRCHFLIYHRSCHTMYHRVVVLPSLLTLPKPDSSSSNTEKIAALPPSPPREMEAKSTMAQEPKVSGEANWQIIQTQRQYEWIR